MSWQRKTERNGAVMTQSERDARQWLAARGELLAKEKELTSRSDQLAAERRGLHGCDREAGAL